MKFKELKELDEDIWSLRCCCDTIHQDWEIIIKGRGLEGPRKRRNKPLLKIIASKRKILQWVKQ